MKKHIFLVISLIYFLHISGLSNRIILGSCLQGCAVPDTTWVEKIVKTKAYEAKTYGIRFARIETYMDSGYYPKSLYYNIRFAEILGANLSELSKGKLLVELINEDAKKLPLIKEARFYVAKTFKDRDEINVLFSIPLDPADPANKKYSYSLIFETDTGKKLIRMTGQVGLK